MTKHNMLWWRRSALACSLLLAVSALAAKLPALINIDGQKWGIKLVDRIEGNWELEGSTECGKRTILVKKSLAPYARAEVITHEVFHAWTCRDGAVHNELLNNSGKANELDGHEGIYFAGPKLHQFIRDNPELMKYIMESDPPPIEIDPLFLPHQIPTPVPR